jgi:hypothetical protein
MCAVYVQQQENINEGRLYTFKCKNEEVANTLIGLLANSLSGTLYAGEEGEATIVKQESIKQEILDYLKVRKLTITKGMVKKITKIEDDEEAAEETEALVADFAYSEGGLSEGDEKEEQTEEEKRWQAMALKAVYAARGNTNTVAAYEDEYKVAYNLARETKNS